MHLICKEGNKENIITIINILKNKNIHREVLNSQDNKGWSPIYYAIDTGENGYPEIVDLLLKNGSEVNYKDSKGITPLHLSAYKGQDDNIEILLKNKADPNIKDILGSI